MGFIHWARPFGGVQPDNASSILFVQSFKRYSSVYGILRSLLRKSCTGTCLLREVQVSGAVKAAVEDARKTLLASTNNKSTTAFSYSGNSLVGLYAGHGVLHSDAATTALQHFTQHLEAQETIGRVLLQYYGVKSNKVLGIVDDTSGDFQAVQRIMRNWNEAKCQTDLDGSKKLTNTALRLERPFAYSNLTTDHLTRRHLHHGAHNHHSIHRLPDLTPKPEPDGTCASAVVGADEWCSTIAAANGITVEGLDEFYKNTWGWAGCDLLQAQQRICISEGDPPMPASIENAVCGPQVPGTERPTNGTELADLNPCPLKTCCNIWGTVRYHSRVLHRYRITQWSPWYFGKWHEWCVSNCGTDIVNNDTPPDIFITIRYFEAWNFERECLNMDITYFDTSAYSHLHFAFAEITEDYQVDVSAVQDQFNSLLSMGDVHRVLSFGGWSFSTEVDSFPIFREGVTDANRELFATNVVNFIVDNDLEGVDFDWEYPGAPDIPGIPASDAGDGERYLQFLKLVREKLPDSKTLAIAAPASFWYLKGFPIAEISEVVDYIVYMTYDLHGQWDYGNQYATSGCPKGNCLRSHVNLTETTSALSMITMAGVPSNKIIVGLASYGRSFRMIEAGCTGPMCKYVGPDSGAAKGECTNTAGYIADAEICRISDEDATAETYYDNSSDSNILVYGSAEWSFAFSGGGNGGDSDGDANLNQSIVYISPSIWTDAEDSAAVQRPAPCVLVLPDFPLGSTSVISRPPYVTTLDVAWPTAATLTAGGSTVTTTTVTRILQETIINAPAVTVTSLPIANLNITVPIQGNSTLTIAPRPRFPAQTVTITNDPNPLSITGVSHPPVTRSVTLPPWPQGTVIYYPSDYVDNGEDDNNDDDSENDDEDDSNDDNNEDEDNNDDDDDDDDIDLPPIPVITVKDGPGSPPCSDNEICGSLCSGPLDFCSCFICPNGGGAGDGGFSDPNDPPVTR
ncbi:hypothetical protein BDV10DRAFT_186556 [Aspergillus recurvatus]